LKYLWECCLTIITNISPYVQGISKLTSSKLLSLFKALTNPKFLFRKDKNHRYCFYLVEAFNNILQYQYTGNSHLVYTIIRNKSHFNKLLRLKLEDTKPNEPTENQLGIFDQPPQNPSEPSPQNQIESPVNPPIELQQGPQVNLEQREKAPTEVKFTPTTEWLESWHKQLPILTIIRFLKAIVPRVKTMITNSTDDQAKILAFLENTTMVGILPLPHPIILRKFSPTIHALNWFHSYMWGVVFLKMLNSGSTLLDTDVKLFIVQVDKNSK